ncbi:MAG: multicopper oxidase domain-containing protein, partial [Planctomycetota bacterium]
AEAVAEREFLLAAETDLCTGNRWSINGERWADAPSTVEPWTTEIWSFANDSTLTQTMHLQQTSFQILDRTPFQLVGGQVVTTGGSVPPAAEESAWKDTVQVPPGVVTRVIARFDHYSGTYAFGGTALGRRDHDLKRAFTVEPQMGSFCNGDGGDLAGCTICPCANDAPAGTFGGCLNNRGRAGFLQASGVPSVANDTLRFEARDTALSTFGVLLSGSQRAPANAANPCFGTDSGIASPNLNGLRCVVQNVQRHGSRSTDFAGNIGVLPAGAGSNGWGAPSGPVGGLIAQGGFAVGQTRHYQLFYREAAFLGCSNDVNTSQGVSVTFLP